MKSIIPIILLAAAACQPSQATQGRPPAIGPSSATTDRAQVVARIDGEPVTAGELDDSVKGGILRADIEHAQKVHELRENGLEKLVNDKLVAKKAKAANTTPEKLLETEVFAKIQVPNDQEMHELYDQ